MDYNDFDRAVITGVKEITSKQTKVVTVLLSGRPRIVNNALNESSAFMAAWWPGTSGGAAIANTLSGKYHFCQGHTKQGSDACQPDSPNTLSVEWVNDMSSLKDYPTYVAGKGFESYPDPKFNIGYGLAD